MSFWQRLRSPWHRRSPAPVLPPSLPALAPTPLFDPRAAPRPPPVPSMDVERVRNSWNAHLTHNPGMSAAQFLRILEDRYRFFAEERMERQMKLAALQKSIEPSP